MMTSWDKRMTLYRVREVVLALAQADAFLRQAQVGANTL